MGMQRPAAAVGVLFVSDALRAAPREGAQVLAGELAKHCETAHGAVSWGPATDADTSAFEPVLTGRLLGARAVRGLLRHQRATVIYLPQNGLTTASLLRALLLALLSRARSLDFVVLQHYTRPRAAWRVFAKRWRFLVATGEQDEMMRNAGLVSAPLHPRVPAAKLSQKASRYEARAALGWGPELQFLHVGHARRGRNLMALLPLASSGILRLVISDYKSEEPDSLPTEGPRVQVHRGECSDLADRYRAATVYVFPTYDIREVIGLPMSVFESLANGTPVVARRSAALERWSALPGLHLVDNDDELVSAARAFAADGQSGDVAVQPSITICLGDLTPCASALNEAL